jgi:hypothetical protein
MKDIIGKELVYKAQWPLRTNEIEPQILIYPAKTRHPWIHMPASDEMFKRLFDSRYCRVYFRGVYKADNTIEIIKFVRHQDWL